MSLIAWFCFRRYFYFSWSHLGVVKALSWYWPQAYQYRFLSHLEYDFHNYCHFTFLYLPLTLCALSPLVVSGAVEHGNHYSLTMVYEHILERSAFNMTYGPFGRVKSKLSIIIHFWSAWSTSAPGCQKDFKLKEKIYYHVGRWH